MITRTAMRFQQKDKRVYFSTFTAEELSEFCGVAQLQESDLDNQNKYQRDVTQSKINEITEWWDEEENYLPNPVIIYFPNFDNVSIRFPEGQDNGSIRVDVAENIAQILDGQHRVNGCHGSVNFRMELLPVTIIFGGEGGDFTPQEVGRMFITMNSKSDRIGKLLEMHLLARNNIPPWNDANQAGYLLMRELYRNNTRNPLFGKIQIMDRRQGFSFKSNKLATTFNTLSSYPRDEGGIAGLNSEQSYRLVTSYLTQVCEIWSEAWASDSSALYSEDIMEIVLKLFKHFYSIAQEGMPPGRIYPSPNDWQSAINGTNPNEPLSNYVTFFDPVYTAYSNSRRQHEISTIIKRLRAGPGGVATAVLEDFNSIEEYLSLRAPDEFEIQFQNANGEVLDEDIFVITDQRVEGGLFVQWDQSRLAGAKADLTIAVFQNNEWVTLQRRQFTSSTRHDLFSHQIPRGWRSTDDGWNSGNRYKFSITQSSPTNIHQTSERIFSFE